MNPLPYTELKQKSINYNPMSFVKEFGFEETLNIAHQMLISREWDESLQEYAVDLLEELREKFSKKWDSSWKYDAFLGYAYDIILKYDKRYDSYKRAFDKIRPPPPQLLIAMAECCWSPGKPPITEEEAISLVKQAIKTTPYIEGIELLRGLYKSTGNAKEQIYWETILDNIKNNAPHLPSLDQIMES